MFQINFLAIERNSEARSRKHFCRGKEISIAYSQCVFVTVVIQHVKHVCRITLSPVAGMAVLYFPTLSHKRHNCRKRC
jgi:hypothetical protein